jgi:DNA-directed RNA polymerase specialized sigma24 family protein
MLSPDEQRIGEYEKVVAAAAYRFRRAAEYDDLYQEGMIAVWRCPPDASPQVVQQAVYNRLKDWVRFIKRLRHFQTVNYMEIVDGLHDRSGGESSEELL